ncbi:unnamed protein product [Prorocentrum cordatum]|uniref:EF-hand domain-containing protein n=1 Tax=Prorocentrum cordatum TaxID=2364126 RepID=A0ABN9W3C4_9DINO|nr:unnamed protein product [Polarella glacialis]
MAARFATQELAQYFLKAAYGLEVFYRQYDVIEQWDLDEMITGQRFDSTATPDGRVVRSTAELTTFALHERGLDAPPLAASPALLSSALQLRRPSLVKRTAFGIIQSPLFDYFMSAIIVANCLVIGLEIQESVGSKTPSSPVFQALEHCFLATYIVELSLRMVSDLQECIRNAWLQLDIALVALGVVTLWVLEPLLLMQGAVEVLDKVLVIRILRLLRFVRAVRFLRVMQPLWKLVKGLLGSNGSVTAAGVLLFGTIYVFACAGVAVIGLDKDLLSDPIAGHIVANRFRSIPVLMLTLLEFTYCDGASQIYHPLVRAKPVLLFYFLPILLVVPMAIMNLGRRITAVIVNHAIKVSCQDAELERIQIRGRLEALVPILNNLFKHLDSEGQGYIRFADLDLARMGILPMPPEVLRALKSYKLEDFFRLLDADGTGRITQAEWVDGMCCLVLDEMPIENLQMLHVLYRQAKDLKDIKSVLLPRMHTSTSRSEASSDA